MGDFIITGKIVSGIIETTFKNVEYQPEENMAILNISTPFIHQMLNTKDISDDDKRFLLSIKDKLRLKSVYEASGNNESEDMDFSLWFPLKTYLSFQKEVEQCSFFIKDPNDDMKIGEGGYYVSWISRSNRKIDMTSLKPSKVCENITIDKWGLTFNGSNLYQINGIGIRNDDGVCICVSFCTRDLDSETFIIYEGDDDTLDIRGISIFKDELRIWGVNNRKNYISIAEIAKNKYITLFIEYPALGENNPGRYFIDNSKEGTFNVRDFEGISSMDIHVGGRPGFKSGQFNGVIASLDIFYRKKSLRVPTHLINLILDRHMISI
jgi:hypothetical protein